KKNNKFIEDRYRQDKKRIETYIKEKFETIEPLSIIGTKSCNKGFNAYAWVMYTGNITNAKNLQLNLVSVVNNDIIEKSAVWKGFYFPIFEDNVRPFFDEDGRACFYGYGVTSTCAGTFPSFAQYCLDCDGNPKCYCHYFYYLKHPNDPESYCGRSFLLLLHYPVLLKAFLQSKVMYITGGSGCHPDWEKEYHLTGVTLPADYKTFKKRIELEQLEKGLYRGIYDNYTSYDLEDEIKKAIDYHYTEQ
ncbi:MAG TPA: hypothetical protein VHX42_01355, partial [Candidatus Babeliales bacterium]|nr:hypothetical protein [Candidatus Babeliales bacterium]